MRFIARELSAGQWADRLGAALDFVSLLALVGTQEIHLSVWISVIALAGLRQLSTVRSFGERFALIGPLGTLMAAIAAWRLFHIHPVIAASHAAPIAHAFLWYSPANRPLRGWRIGMGFVELILASVITSDFYLPMLVFAFVVIGSVAIACGFLERELAERSPTHRHQPLPQGFIRRSAGQAFILILASAVIFPLLPRMGNEIGGGGSPSDGARVGYTEEVNVSQWTKLSGTTGGATLLRIVQPDGDDPSASIYLGLLRTRSLELFDGAGWSPSPKKPRNYRTDESQKNNHPFRIQVLREPIASDALPIPYGTRFVRIRNGELDIPANPLRTGEWEDRRSIARRSQYEVAFDMPSFRNGSDTVDEPTAMHRALPARTRTKRLERLAQEVFRGAKTDQEKIDALKSYFRNNQYQASYDTADDPVARAAAEQGLSPLEGFLFVTHAGTCEYFASSAAILLRMVGVPARLVAGFRVNRRMSGGVLNVRASDAHAWLEAWADGRGWIPLDLTPRKAMIDIPWTENLRDAYEAMSGYWYFYVLSYQESGSWRDRALKTIRWVSHRGLTGWSILPITALALFGVILLLRWRWRVRMANLHSISLGAAKVPRSLRAERDRMERLLRRRTLLAGHPAEATLQKWKTNYERARFGRRSDHLVVETVRILRDLRETLTRELKG